MEFMQQVRKYAQDGVIIIAFANDLYLPLFNLWFRLFRKHNLRNYLIFSLDQTLHAKLRARNINSCLLPLEKSAFSRGNLWILRAAVVREILRAGIHVIHTDIDAFWLRNFLELLATHPDDLVISRDRGVPREIVDQWGFTLCCGIYLLRSNAATVKFMDSYLPRVEELKDDQRALNYMLHDAKVVWRQDGANNRHTRVAGHDITVEALSSDIAARGGDQPNAYIFHPWLAPRRTHEKVLRAIAMLRDFPADRRELRLAAIATYLSSQLWVHRLGDPLQGKRN